METSSYCLGNPKSISELNHANYIDSEKPGQLMTLLNSQGFELTERNFPVISNSHIVQWQLVKQGVAITATVDEIGENEPLVKRIEVPGLSPIIIDIWIVTHSELRTNNRMRRVFDFLVSEFSNQ